MAIQHQAWNEGFKAGIADVDPGKNPYTVLTEKWFEWADGWKDAFEHQRDKSKALKSAGIDWWSR